MFMESVPDHVQSGDSPAVRRETAPGETILQLILAAIITVGAGIAAWALAAAAFAGPPEQLAPGIIGVAVETTADTADEPIAVDAESNPDTKEAGSGFGLVFTQIVSKNDVNHPSPTVIVFLCGPIAEHPEFRDAGFRSVTWTIPVSPDPEPYSSVFGYLAECVDTKLALPTSDSLGEFRQALIQGSFSTPTSDVSGTKALYTMPGIANWFMPVPIDGLTPSTLPRGSTVQVHMTKDLSDFTNVFASPQLPDAGSLTWKSTLDGTSADSPAEEYRLEADSQTALSQLQFHLFLAGALVGIAGGAFVWLVQLGAQAGYGSITQHFKRKKPKVPKEKRSELAGHGTPEPGTPQPSQSVVAGLGWPS
jgi:hypothetical protein